MYETIAIWSQFRTKVTSQNPAHLHYFHWLLLLAAIFNIELVVCPNKSALHFLRCPTICLPSVKNIRWTVLEIWICHTYIQTNRFLALEVDVNGKRTACIKCFSNQWALKALYNLTFTYSCKCLICVYATCSRKPRGSSLSSISSLWEVDWDAEYLSALQHDPALLWVNTVWWKFRRKPPRIPGLDEVWGFCEWLWSIPKFCSCNVLIHEVPLPLSAILSPSLNLKSRICLSPKSAQWRGMGVLGTNCTWPEGMPDHIHPSGKEGHGERRRGKKTHRKGLLKIIAHSNHRHTQNKMLCSTAQSLGSTSLPLEACCCTQTFLTTDGAVLASLFYFFAI